MNSPAARKRNWLLPALLGGAGLGAMAYGLSRGSKPNSLGPIGATDPKPTQPTQPARSLENVYADTAKAVDPTLSSVNQALGQKPVSPTEQKTLDVAGTTAGATGLSGLAYMLSQTKPAQKVLAPVAAQAGSKWLPSLATAAGKNFGRLAGFGMKRILPPVSGYLYASNPAVRAGIQDYTGMSPEMYNMTVRPAITGVSAIPPVGYAAAVLDMMGNRIDNNLTMSTGNEQFAQNSGDLLMKAMKDLPGKRSMPTIDLQKALSQSPTLLENLQNANMWLEANKGNMPTLRQTHPTVAALANNPRLLEAIRQMNQGQ